MKGQVKGYLILSIGIVLGLFIFAKIISVTAIKLKGYDRTVVVKGLSQREYPADIAIWPIKYSRTGNNLTTIYDSLEKDRGKIIDFLTKAGFSEDEISFTPPTISDKLLGYGDNNNNNMPRYSGTQIVTVYTQKIDLTRTTSKNLEILGKNGVILTGRGNYNTPVRYIFTKLNEVKPSMIEDATKNAREVATRFAKDSKSKLGKIAWANQGQFSIRDRDQNTPYIKKVRVVSTVRYYLAD